MCHLGLLLFLRDIQIARSLYAAEWSEEQRAPRPLYSPVQSPLEKIMAYVQLHIPLGICPQDDIY